MFIIINPGRFGRYAMLLCLCLIAVSAGAYQNSALSLFTPSELAQSESEISIMHRFYGAVDEEPLETFFGLDTGANISLSLRRNIKYSLEAKASYTKFQNRYALGCAWKPTTWDFPVHAQLDLEYFNFALAGIEERRSNFLYLLSVQNNIWDKYSILTINTGYDGYYQRMVYGLGLHLLATEKITVLAEYYPDFDRKQHANENDFLGKYDAYAFGIKLDTYGHHFIFLLGNSSGMNPATQSLGTNNAKDLHFGFNLQRRI